MCSIRQTGMGAHSVRLTCDKCDYGTDQDEAFPSQKPTREEEA